MIETLFALFFISTALLVTAQILISATRLQQQVEQAMGGAHFADQILSQLKANVAGGGNPSNGSGTSDDFPGYKYRIEVAQAGLYSPCSTRELQYPVAERRWISNPGYQVKVTVSWDPPNPRNQAIAYGLLLRKLPTLKDLRISPDSGNVVPVAKDKTVQYTVDARDSSGGSIRGVFFHWYNLPQTGNGQTVSKSRDGRRGEFTHQYQSAYGPPVYFPANSYCKMRARARFNGKEVECDTDPIYMTDI